MRLDRKKEEEVARRKGNAGKTIIQSIWLLISIGIGYFLASYLLNQGTIAHRQIAELYVFFRNAVVYLPSQAGIGSLITAGSVSETTSLWTLVIIIVIIMQFFLYVGFMFTNPEGRRKLGDPTLVSRNKDPLDREG